MAIRQRLIGSLVLLSLLPLLVSGYISYVESSNAIRNKARVFATEVVKQVSKNVQLRMANIENNSEALVLSDRVQSALTYYADNTAASKAKAQAEMPNILLNAYGSFEHINQKYFLDRDHQIMDSQVFSQLSRNVVQFAEQAPRLLGRPHWGTFDVWGGQKGIVMLRDIYLKANNQFAGSLFIGLGQSYFSEVFSDVNLGDGSDIFIVDARDGSVIAGNTSGDGGANPSLIEEIRQTQQRAQQTGSMTYTRMGDAKETQTSSIQYVSVFSLVPGTSWFVVNVIPSANLVVEARSLRDNILLIGSVCLVFAILLSFILWRSISDPLEQLVGLMKEAEAGHFPTQKSNEGQDELTVLSQKFREMSATISLEHERLEERVLERTQDLNEANQKLAALSNTDALTGIANRRQFDDVLASEWRRAARLGQSLAVGMIDIDWFKRYNDRYGHQAGDECLRGAANVFASCVHRPGDLVARYGGEEFVFIAPATDGDAALRIARQICEAIQALALPHELSSFGCVTASIGVAAMVPREEIAANVLVKAADRAMYRAKERGRNQAVL